MRFSVGVRFTARCARGHRGHREEVFAEKFWLGGLRLGGSDWLEKYFFRFFNFKLAIVSMIAIIPNKH